jgi:hypothetical protein
MSGVTFLATEVGIVTACAMLAVARASYYRSLRLPMATVRRPSPRALSVGERATVLDALHEPRFVDLAPAEVYATLLDEGRYLCSERTMYRILEANQEVRDRRDQLRHMNHPRPELLATKRTSSGAGTSPNSRGRRSGLISTSTSSSMSSVAMSSAGWWRPRRAPHSPRNSCPRRAIVRASRRASSDSTRTEGAR